MDSKLGFLVSLPPSERLADRQDTQATKLNSKSKHRRLFQRCTLMLADKPPPSSSPPSSGYQFYDADQETLVPVESSRLQSPSATPRAPALGNGQKSSTKLENSLILSGRVDRNPRTRDFASGSKLVDFSLKVMKRISVKKRASASVDSWKNDKEPSFTAFLVPVKLWSSVCQTSLDQALHDLVPGTLVTVTGYVDFEEYSRKDGSVVSQLIVVANDYSLLSPPAPSRPNLEDHSDDEGRDREQAIAESVKTLDRLEPASNDMNQGHAEDTIQVGRVYHAAPSLISMPPQLGNAPNSVAQMQQRQQPPSGASLGNTQYTPTSVSSSELYSTSKTSPPTISLNTSFRNWWPMNEEEYRFAVSTGSVPSTSWNSPNASAPAQSSLETLNYTRAPGMPVNGMTGPKSATIDSGYLSNKPNPYSSMNSSMRSTTDSRFCEEKNDPYSSSRYESRPSPSTLSSVGPGMKRKDWWPSNEGEYLEAIGLSSMPSSVVSHPSPPSMWSNSQTPANQSTTKPGASNDARTEYNTQRVPKLQVGMSSWSSPPPSNVAGSKLLTDDESEDIMIEKKSDGRLPMRSAMSAEYISQSAMTDQHTSELLESVAPPRNGVPTDSLLSKASKSSGTIQVSQFASSIRASRMTEDRDRSDLEHDDDDEDEDEDEEDGQSDEEPMDEPF